MPEQEGRGTPQVSSAKLQKVALEEQKPDGSRNQMGLGQLGKRLALIGCLKAA